MQVNPGVTALSKKQEVRGPNGSSPSLPKRS